MVVGVMKNMTHTLADLPGETVDFDSWLWRFLSLMAWSFFSWVCGKAEHLIRERVAEQSLSSLPKDEG